MTPNGIVRSVARLKGGSRLVAPLRLLELLRGRELVRVAHMQDGSKLLIDLRAPWEWQAYYAGKLASYEEPWIQFCQAQISKHGGHFLDVGANIGAFAVRVGLRLRPGDRCICFEPVEANCLRLLDNITLNKLNDVVDVFQFGLSDRAGEVQLGLADGFREGASTGNAAMFMAGHHARTVTATVGRLDDIIVATGPIGVVKVDIEGHEPQFLRGAAQTLAAHRPMIVCEINKPYYAWRHTNADQQFDGALPAGYRLLRLKKGRWQIVPYIQDVGELENVLFCPEEKTALL